MANNKIRILKARKMRLTKVDRCGNPIYGIKSTVVTSGMAKVEFSPEIENGTEYQSKNGWGDYEINEKDPPFWKWLNMTITMTHVDPAVMEIVAAGTPAVVGDDVIGVAFDGEINLGAFALEMWTKKAQGACEPGEQAWGYTLVPLIVNGTASGAVTHEDATFSIEMSAEGIRAPEWGAGPYAQNPYRTEFPPKHMYGMVLTTVQPPEDTDGAIPLVTAGNAAAVVPGDVFAAETTVTAQDTTNAAKLAGLGYQPASTDAWASGEYFTVGAFSFFWTGTAWAAGSAA